MSAHVNIPWHVECYLQDLPSLEFYPTGFWDMMYGKKLRGKNEFKQRKRVKIDIEAKEDEQEESGDILPTTESK